MNGVTYLVYGTRKPNDMCWYPRSNKVSFRGIKLIGRYGANAQHTLFFIVEADHIDAIHQFLWPGFKKCTATITPVSEFPVPKP